MSISTSITLAIWLLAAAPETPLVMVPDPQAALRPETADQTSARHAKMARARDGTVILLHRGAWDYAPENTLSAIRGRMGSGLDLELKVAPSETSWHRNRTTDSLIRSFSMTPWDACSSSASLVKRSGKAGEIGSGLEF